jgi:hypothetical protein
LNAGQILATDPEKKCVCQKSYIQATDSVRRRRWEAHINQLLAERGPSKAEYIILRSEQLVGTALFVIAKTRILPSIRHIEAATKKTGLKGMAGVSFMCRCRLR